jgi:phosphoenolpyruvate-protein kinase (PTS system EI component)
MTAAELVGVAAAGGVAVGRALVLREPDADATGEGGAASVTCAVAALDAAATELAASAERLRAEGLAAGAAILDTNALMAADPVLRDEVESLALELPAGAALRRAAERHAALLAALPDPLLAARAADVRELGRRAARLAAGTARTLSGDGPAILIARDLGPADVADLRESSAAVSGLALAEGAPTSHAAIMARSLGLPMAVALGEDILRVADGGTLVLDGDRGRVYVEPAPEVEEWGRTTMAWAAALRRTLAGARTLPPVTCDGRRISLLCNAGSDAEVRAGLDAGAEGIGLLRTELAFLEARAWPGEEEHLRALGPLLGPVRGRLATVRTLDFGGDKTPPFLAGIAERGLALMLAHAGALEAQLRAIVAVGTATRLRILLPLVESPEQVRTVRRLLAPDVELGAMIETPTAAARAAEIAAASDFVSIGTNDLVQYTLGLDRARPLASAATAADPAILRLVDEIVSAAHAAGRPVEVCGEAAGEPADARLLVGLGVAPARLDEIRATVRGLSAAEAAEAARLAQLRHEDGEVVGSGSGVGA